MKTLHLVLKAQWYNMIESGEKKEEYRETKPYWVKRLLDCGKGCMGLILNGELVCPVCRNLNYAKYDSVCFHYGYTNRKMTYRIENICLDYGKVEWGAEEEKLYFVIKLGERED